MRITYWGVRGSIPVPGISTVRHGGNTPCVGVELADETLLILDGGTGLRLLGHHLMRQESFAHGRGRATMLFTHRHWDHIHGLPFFEPAYRPGNLFAVHHPPPLSGSPLEDNIVSLQHNLVGFPVPYDRIRSAYRFNVVAAATPFVAGGADILPVRLNHPGVTFGYVIAERASGAKLAYVTDTAPWREPLLGEGLRDQGPADQVASLYQAALVSAVRGADLLIHDTFFDEAGYGQRPEWGHSAPSHALDLCRAAGARRLHLFHYAPYLTDDDVAKLEDESRAAAVADGIQVAAAVEGMSITLP